MTSKYHKVPTRPSPPSGLSAWDPEQACPGYTLYCSLQKTPYVYLIDMNGEPVHTWYVKMVPNHSELSGDGNVFENNVACAKRNLVAVQKIVDSTHRCHVRDADNSDIPSKNVFTSSIVLYR